MSTSGLHFALSSSTTRFGPRLGNLTLNRSGDAKVTLETPGLSASTSRGVIPHLSRDHYGATEAVKLVQVPWESFLEHKPPVPTLVSGDHPLHSFLGYQLNKHVLIMSVRDPADGREMPANGQTHQSAVCIRGVRKVTADDWRSYVSTCKPDIAIAMSDTPFTHPPYSQKRMTKSIERSTSWLLNLLQARGPAIASSIFVQMAGGVSIAARKAFAEGLVEPLSGPESNAAPHLNTLDDGVAGYTFDLVPLHLALAATEESSPVTLKPTTPSSFPEKLFFNRYRAPVSSIVPLLQTSLGSVPVTKPRQMNSVTSPHDILRLIQDVGVDIFDGQWAQSAAEIGIALDFIFPAKPQGSKQKLGHNLYDDHYTTDFTSLSNNHPGRLHATNASSNICVCAACSPVTPSTRIIHSTMDLQPDEGGELRPAYTKAYIHHLLHTHEMTAHSLLVMHNLTILDNFFRGIRASMEQDVEQFSKEMEVFIETYEDTTGALFKEAEEMWKTVELARGKGRVSREKAELASTQEVLLSNVEDVQ